MWVSLRCYSGDLVIAHVSDERERLWIGLGFFAGEKGGTPTTPTLPPTHLPKEKEEEERRRRKKGRKKMKRRR